MNGSLAKGRHLGVGVGGCAWFLRSQSWSWSGSSSVFLILEIPRVLGNWKGVLVKTEKLDQVLSQGQDQGPQAVTKPNS